MERMASRIRFAGNLLDAEGGLEKSSSIYKEKFVDLLSRLPEYLVVDQYYLAFGFQSLRESDLKIIRADMLIERATRSFAESRAASPKVIDSLRQYAAIRSFAKAMTEPGETSWVWMAAKHLSDARNNVAHELENIEVEKHMANFYKAVGIPPAENYENLEQAVIILSGHIFQMKQSWLDRKAVCERLYAESQQPRG